jgi:hypothetical protein
MRAEQTMLYIHSTVLYCNCVEHCCTGGWWLDHFMAAKMWVQ